MTRSFALAAAALAVLASSSAAPAEAASQPDARPNVVVFMTDDQNVSSLAVMPNVKALLANAGTTFANSFVAYPLCCPSRATYLTGQYPHNHDVLANVPPDGGYYQLRGDETLPVWLSRAGYQTAHIGKYLNGYGTQDPLEIPRGWGEWYGSVDPSTYRMWGYTLNENGTLVTYGQDDVEDPALYQTDVYARKAVEYINRKAPGDAPFFLSVAPLAPHLEAGWAATHGTRNPRPAPRHRGAFANAPLPMPPSFNEADVSDKPAHIRALPPLSSVAIAQITRTYRSRLESLLAVDEAVKSIVDTLAARGELDRTLFVFTSDNGWLQGEHRIPNGKIHPYEESIRVPLIVRGPGVPAGATSTVLAGNIDLAPTVLAAAQAVPGITVDGRSLLGSTAPGRPALLVETGPRTTGARWYAAIRTARFVYIEHSTGERELYDLAIDPSQLLSRHNDLGYAQVRAALAEQLHRLQVCVGQTC
jgi:arylsulfatase A-like enzyme